MFECDDAIYAEVWTGTSGRRGVEGDINCHSAIHCSRINPNDVARNGSVARIDGSALIELNISGLCFGDPDYGLELCRVGDTCERGACQDLLSDLKGLFISQCLQDARD